jgi:hypothetical protein
MGKNDHGIHETLYNIMLLTMKENYVINALQKYKKENL